MKRNAEKTCLVNDLKIGIICLNKKYEIGISHPVQLLLKTTKLSGFMKYFNSYCNYQIRFHQNPRGLKRGLVVRRR